MLITYIQKKIIDNTISAFETGKLVDYAAIALLPDGPGHSLQVTYGKHQTTETTHLQALLQAYANSNGIYNHLVAPFIAKVGRVPSVLVLDQLFLLILKEAGNRDPIMQQVQDAFFDQFYYNPAKQWAETNGFMQPLSMLVIYDSFVHSGGIPQEIRNMFAEKVPAQGGNEKTWITEYVTHRQNWLANHPNPIVHSTVYRTQCLLREINKGNWDLSKLPITTNGVNIYGV